MISQIFKFIWNRKGRNLLLTIELIFSFLIVFGVLTFVFENLEQYNSPLGFETENLLVAHLNPDPLIDSLEIKEMKAQLKSTLNDSPEIENLSYGDMIYPFSGSAASFNHDSNGYSVGAYMMGGDEDFSKTMKLKLKEGRWYTSADLSNTTKPVVVNQVFVDKYFADSALVVGKKLIMDMDEESQIVGVVENLKYRGEFEEEWAMSVTNANQGENEPLNLYIRLKEGTGPGFEQELNNKIKNILPNWSFAIEDLDHLRQTRSKEYWIPIVASLCVSAFLILNVALGLFGVLLYNIKKRTSEIGLRRAIGASPSNISMMMTTEMLLLTLVSLLIGFFFAIQFPILEVFEIENAIYFKAMFFAALLIFILVLLCTIYPSQMAARIQPASALHNE